MPEDMRIFLICLKEGIISLNLWSKWEVLLLNLSLEINNLTNGVLSRSIWKRSELIRGENKVRRWF